MDLANGGRINPSAERSGHDHSLADLVDADSNGAVDGDVLTHTGDGWAPLPPVPVGTLIASARELTDPPIGYLHASGTRVSRTSYAELYEVLGDRYGAGDGATTFNVPSCTGTFGGETVTWWVKY